MVSLVDVSVIEIGEDLITRHVIVLEPVIGVWVCSDIMQLPVCPRESVAVHTTGSVPSGNVVLEAGEQATLTGVWPPWATGVSKATFGGAPLCANA